MNHGFFKFPSTPHLILLDDVAVRENKILSTSERDEFLKHDLIVEEKVDGANLGISFDATGEIRVQNRGAYLHAPYPGQWQKLPPWLNMHADSLFEQLTDRYILFGEWCYAEHSVGYTRLPDWFLGFDIYDKTDKKFMACSRRNKLFQGLGISPVPLLATGRFTLEELTSLLSQSKFSNSQAEGIYLRVDKGRWLEMRSKLVRPSFIQSVEQHWSRSGIKRNRLNTNIRQCPR